jgi:lactate dehydrogenase-like 2-hydroxyacid dehydrogenase
MSHPDSGKPSLLLPIDLPANGVAILAENFLIHHIQEGPRWADRLEDHAGQVGMMLTRGSIGVTREHMARLPKLRLICCLGAGFERVDLDAARERGIAVTNGTGANAPCVADHAMGLLIAAMRGLLVNDRATRAGRWSRDSGMPPSPNGRTLGILGLGNIGMEVARRAEAFSMTVMYHNRKRRDDAPWTYVEAPLALAERCDALIVALPDAPETRHLVDAALLRALGPEGFLVNVGRGSVVDNDALVAALRAGVIAGAGLDVYDGEPQIPAGLAELDNVILTPHMAGRSDASYTALVRLAEKNLLACLAGKPLVNRVA